MQLFVTSKCPRESAAYLDDKRLIKQIVECTQVMSVALSKKGFPPLLKLTHQHHPITEWVCDKQANFNWTYAFFKFCVKEYEARYNKKHKWSNDKHFILGLAEHHLLADTFINLTPYKDMEVCEAYKKLLLDKWLSDKVAPRITLKQGKIL